MNQNVAKQIFNECRQRRSLSPYVKLCSTTNNTNINLSSFKTNNSTKNIINIKNRSTSVPPSNSSIVKNYSPVLTVNPYSDYAPTIEVRIVNILIFFIRFLRKILILSIVIIVQI